MIELEGANISEECWRELLKDYSALGPMNMYSSEADIQLHLAHKIMGKLYFPTCGHIEFSILTETAKFETEYYIYWQSQAKEENL